MCRAIFRLCIVAVCTAAVIAASEFLTWQPSPSGNAVTGYKVFWATNIDDPKPWTVIARVTGLSAPGMPVVPGVKNYYYGTSTNSCCESDPSFIAFRPDGLLNFRVEQDTGGTLMGFPFPQIINLAMAAQSGGERQTMSVRVTHTYGILELSPSAFKEIKDKLSKAGYSDQFHEKDGRTIIDMHGIAVAQSRIEKAEDDER